MDFRGKESMAYTVKQLSELSRVTARTIHFYEEIELLKPAYYGANGYRYYEEKELLQLQQILFFKELGLSLKQIQKVVGSSDFDQLAALHSHKKALSKEWEKIGKLLETIDKTIKHLKGKKKMKDKEIFEGFGISIVKQANLSAEAIVGKSIKNPTKSVADVETRGKAFYEAISKTAHGLFKELVRCIEQGQDLLFLENQRQKWGRDHILSLAGLKFTLSNGKKYGPADILRR